MATVSFGSEKASVNQLLIFGISFGPQHHAILAIHPGVGAGGTQASAAAFADDARDDLASPPPERTSIGSPRFFGGWRLATGREVSDVADDHSLSVNAVTTYRSRPVEELVVRTTAI